ncbi:hypothetical protein MPSEU_000997100 [Mayamaea pseudoterrestris]|nr:hypothetical protein MPSEU_000997100 [Mayamaea pseudoterrestris]
MRIFTFKSRSGSLMAKKWNRSKKDRRPHGKGKDHQQQDGGRNYVSTVVDQGNFKFEAYYAAQGLFNSRYDDETSSRLIACETHEERNNERLLWRKTIGSALPASFRIAKDVPINIQQHIKGEIEQLALECKAENSTKPVIQAIPFLPGAYQFSLDRTTIRKHPALEKLHHWLKEKTDAGFISRQETVSMIPPVVLNVQPSHCVADLCAAPGSKASQLLEALGPNGFMVANDANWQRAHMLVTQLRRILHNNPVCMITNCNAQFFPAAPLQFDSILCDVPCSGDATTRKNIGIWKRWSQLAAFGMHSLQVDISWKACAQLLKVGGHLCYSTCSFNPIENEAVVAELLRRSEGKLELMVISLNGFRTRPGMSDWKVFCEPKSRRDMMNEYKKTCAKVQERKKEWEAKQKESAEADEGAASAEAPADEKTPAPFPVVPNRVKYEPTCMADDAAILEMAKSAGLSFFETHDDVPDDMKKRVRPSAFSPTEDEAKSFHLERCIRAFPQDNDTGGFFIALLRKKDIMSARDRRAVNEATAEATSPAAKRVKTDDVAPVEDDEDDVGAPQEDDAGDDDADLDMLDDENKPIRGPVRGKDGKAVTEFRKDDFSPVDDDVINAIIDFYGLTLPGFRRDLYMTRATGDAKIIYYVAPTVKEIIDQGFQTKLTMINTGLKGFTRNSKFSEVSYRLCQEGAHFLAPFMSKRKFVVSREDFDICLNQKETTHLSAFSSNFHDEMKELTTGSFIIILDGFAERHGEKMILAMWKCRGDSVDGMVAKVEKDIMKTKLAALDAYSK